MEANTLVLRDRVDSEASWPMAREMSTRTDFLTIFFFTVSESGVGSRKNMAAAAREGDDAPKQSGLLMAEETPFMRSRMSFICCNISVDLDINADISDSGAESSDTMAMANSIWEKNRVPKLKAPNTNCNDSSLLNSNHKTLGYKLGRIRGSLDWE